LAHRFYDTAASLFAPFVVWWGRLRVNGLDCIPAAGPVLIVPNHDSQWDPVVVSVAVRNRRQIHYLSRANLWRIPGLGPVLDALGQIPVERGTGDMNALSRAREVLQSGEAVGVFPEGTLSWGEPLRARSGVGVLAASCPEASIVLCQVEGTTDFVRFPRRPRATVTFFPPAGGPRRADEEPAALAVRLMADIRARVPPVPAGRKAIVGGPPRVQALKARLNAKRQKRDQSLGAG
jgi:1-acyl-sn-glycerol-3-phosphate acyltransferase